MKKDCKDCIDRSLTDCFDRMNKSDNFWVRLLVDRFRLAGGPDKKKDVLSLCDIENFADNWIVQYVLFFTPGILIAFFVSTFTFPENSNFCSFLCVIIPFFYSVKMNLQLFLDFKDAKGINATNSIFALLWIHNWIPSIINCKRYLAEFLFFMAYFLFFSSNGNIFLSVFMLAISEFPLFAFWLLFSSSFVQPTKSEERVSIM